MRARRIRTFRHEKGPTERRTPNSLKKKKKTMVEAAVLNGQEGRDPEPYATAIPFGRELGLAVISVSEAGCRPRLPW